MTHVDGTDPSPWNTLHDGEIADIERNGSTLTFSIEIEYLRERFKEPGRLIVLELEGVESIAYQPFDEQVLVQVSDIMKHDLDILRAEYQDGLMLVDVNSGNMALSYARMSMALDSGRELSQDELQKVAGSYWDEWERNSKAAREEK
ncbi:hypothetical protein OAU50_03345 [Planctomycetota bacterium]|nr:hypothetical protein [Planctomycetota bacterium]